MLQPPPPRDRKALGHDNTADPPFDDHRIRDAGSLRPCLHHRDLAGVLGRYGVAKHPVSEPKEELRVLTRMLIEQSGPSEVVSLVVVSFRLGRHRRSALSTDCSPTPCVGIFNP
jgi:hypothetical protein